jgi:hypothetical protein
VPGVGGGTAGVVGVVPGAGVVEGAPGVPGGVLPGVIGPVGPGLPGGTGPGCGEDGGICTGGFSPVAGDGCTGGAS